MSGNMLFEFTLVEKKKKQSLKIDIRADNNYSNSIPVDSP